MLKGRATIELIDAKTGRVKRIVHDNMVTNAVNYMCKGSGFFAAPATYPAYNNGGTIAEELFGGIMLWESELNEDADDFIIPADNICIGYGCSKSNGTINSMMGTYNTSESGLQEDRSYKHVWDFATNQANGKITAVSLVPKQTGNLGLGLNKAEYDSSLNVSALESYDSKTYYRGEVLNAALYIDGNYFYCIKRDNLYYNSGNEAVHFSRNGGKLIIQKYRFQNTKLSLTERIKYATYLVEEIEVQLPSELGFSATATGFYGFLDYDDGYIYLGLGDNLYSYDGTFNCRICKISCTDYSSEVITVSVSFDYTSHWTTLHSFNRYNGNNKEKYIADGKLFFLAPGNVLHYIELSTPTVAKKVTFSDGSEIASASIRNCAKLGKYIYLSLYGYNSSSNPVYLLNAKTGIISRLNAESGFLPGVIGYENDGVYISVRDIQSGNHYWVQSTNEGSYITIRRQMLPHILTTKNNLEAPVTKTSAQTMKITYVLTETE